MTINLKKNSFFSFFEQNNSIQSIDIAPANENVQFCDFTNVTISRSSENSEEKLCQNQEVSEFQAGLI